MTACPTCGDKFSSTREMREHRSTEHDEPEPNLKCVGCDSEFYDSQSRRKFCWDCDPNAGKNNGNWKDAREQTRCKVCDAEFTYYPSNKKGVYCSDCVDSADGLLPEQYPKRIDRIKKECLHCGSDIEVLPSQIEKQKRGFFCDLDCYGNWLSENVVGPEHRQWRGGGINYGDGWWEVRRKALERDNYRCQVCGASADDLGRNPDVHHIDPVREFDMPTEAPTIDNVVSLCRSCHRNVEAGEVSLE